VGKAFQGGLEELFERIQARVRAEVKGVVFELGDLFESDMVRPAHHRPAVYARTADHTQALRLSGVSAGGSYLLGRLDLSSSIVIDSHLRGDELKDEGESLGGSEGAVAASGETLVVRDSFLDRVLVHSASHDPDNLLLFTIEAAAAMPYAIIHGSPVMGVFLGALSTLDMTVARASSVGVFSYVQAGRIEGEVVPPGRVWIRSGEDFEFVYDFAPAVLSRYIRHEPDEEPAGRLIRVIRAHDDPAGGMSGQGYCSIGPGGSVHPLSVVRGLCRVGENAFVSQGAHLEDAELGPGANAQENSHVVASTLAGYDITAHGAKIIRAKLGERVFVGFNALVRGGPNRLVTVGPGAIIMPHTLIDASEPLTIPGGRLVWGHIRNAADLAENSLPLEDLARLDGVLTRPGLTFRGSGRAFVQVFTNRIEHILEANGAFFDGVKGRGHAQRTRDIAFHILQPHHSGPQAGLLPRIRIEG